MTLAFMNESAVVAFRKIERDLNITNPQVDFAPYKAMSAKRLGWEIEQLDTRVQSMMGEGAYGSWLRNEAYIEAKLLHEALVHLKEYKQIQESKETLVEGFTYYRSAKVLGNRISGLRCTYLGEARPSNWVRFNEHLAVAKSYEVIRHGTIDDFKAIYIGMADGTPDALIRISEAHIGNSSKAALAEMDEYCNTRWSGPWPWETSAPYKLRNRIEEKMDMRKLDIQEMRDRFADLLVQLNEGEVEKAEVILQGREIVDKIQGMIEDLGKLAGEGVLRLKDMARSAIGDNAASQIEQAVTQPLNQAADTLSKLKVQMDQAISGLEGMPSQDQNGGGQNPMMGGQPDMNGGDDHMGDFGSPQDQMGQPPQMGDDGEVADDLAGQVEEKPERAIKVR